MEESESSVVVFDVASPRMTQQPVGSLLDVQQDGLTLMEGGARLGHILLGLVKSVIFEVSVCWALRVIRKSCGGILLLSLTYHT